MTTKIISTLALVLMFAFGTSNAFASEVTGGLTSSGVSSPSDGTSGTLSGTVSSPTSSGGGGSSSGGGGGGAGGNGPISTLGAPQPAATSPTSPQGQVLGAATGPESSGTGSTGGVVTTPDLTTDTLALGLNGEVTTQDSSAPATPGATGFVMETWMWLILLLLAALVGYYAYSRLTRPDNA